MTLPAPVEICGPGVVGLGYALSRYCVPASLLSGGILIVRQGFAYDFAFRLNVFKKAYCPRPIGLAWRMAVIFGCLAQLVYVCIRVVEVMESALQQPSPRAVVRHIGENLADIRAMFDNRTPRFRFYNVQHILNVVYRSVKSNGHVPIPIFQVSGLLPEKSQQTLVVGGLRKMLITCRHLRCSCNTGSPIQSNPDRGFCR